MGAGKTLERTPTFEKSPTPKAASTPKASAPDTPIAPQGALAGLKKSSRLAQMKQKIGVETLSDNVGKGEPSPYDAAYVNRALKKH